MALRAQSGTTLEPVMYIYICLVLETMEYGAALDKTRICSALRTQFHRTSAIYQYLPC